MHKLRTRTSGDDTHVWVWLLERDVIQRSCVVYEYHYIGVHNNHGQCIASLRQSRAGDYSSLSVWYGTNQPTDHHPVRPDQATCLAHGPPTNSITPRPLHTSPSQRPQTQPMRPRCSIRRRRWADSMACGGSGGFGGMREAAAHLLLHT